MRNLPYDKCLFLITMEGKGGLIESRLLKEKVLFSSPDEMLFRIQQMIDWQKFPQQTSSLRRFIARRGGKKVKLTPAEHELHPDPNARQFWIAFRSCNHYEWQGMVGLPNGRIEGFSSFVDLVQFFNRVGYLKN